MKTPGPVALRPRGRPRKGSPHPPPRTPQEAAFRAVQEARGVRTSEAARAMGMGANNLLDFLGRRRPQPRSLRRFARWLRILAVPPELLPRGILRLVQDRAEGEA